MKHPLILVLLAFSAQSQAEDFFQTCEALTDSKEYSLLISKLESEHVNAKFCQKLNNSEFLYVKNGGYYDRFYHCIKTEAKGLECKEDDHDMTFPDLEIAQRFRSKNGKQFVLFKAGRLSHGVYSTGYTIFHLTPKSDTPSGYLIYSLRGAGESSGIYSDEGLECSNMYGWDAITSDNPPFELINNEKNEAIIRFNQKITSCDSANAHAKQTVEYKWVKGRFRLSKDIRVFE